MIKWKPLQPKRTSKGRICVYSPDDKLVHGRLFYTSEGMKSILETWMNIYSRGNYIQIRFYEDRERKDGVPEAEKIKRPPPIYNNIPTYDYFNRKR